MAAANIDTSVTSQGPAKREMSSTEEGDMRALIFVAKVVLRRGCEVELNTKMIIDFQQTDIM